MELYRTHRPTKFVDVLGQPNAVRTLNKLVSSKKVPRALLFSGPSGCGKTTFIRILKRKLRCSNHDYNEINCADFRGIETVREIRSRVNLKPFGGNCRIWALDEVQTLNNLAQNALLKLLEDPPDHAYFMLATTDPQKLLRTIRTRCTDIKVERLDVASLETLVRNICARESKKVSDDVVERIASVADGSARKGLVILHQVLGIENEGDRLNAIESCDVERQAIEIARALFNLSTTWAQMSAILKSVDEEPESLRYMILGYADKILLGGGKLSNRAMAVINAFQYNFYDSKKAGLDASCYRIICPVKR